MSKINIVQISAALGFPVTATFITNTLNIPPNPELSVKRALFWNETDYDAICLRLIAQVSRARGEKPGALSPDRPKADAPVVEPDGFGFGDAQPAAPTEPDGFGFDNAPVAVEEGFFS
jgi:hypothetical protein